jgi:FemAB-related protein (PEP-CTERM system-associated)
VTIGVLETASAAVPRQLAVREDIDRVRWDAYVSAHASASAYHYRSWLNVIERAFRHEAHPLACVDGDRVVGVLPLIVMRSRLFGTFAVSLPFLNAGGVLADHDAAAAALVASATDIAKRASAEYLELRHTERRFPALVERRHRVAMTLSLAPTTDAQWLALDRKIRNQVRKGEKSHLTAVDGGLELVDSFYDVFSRNMRDLGTPVFGRRLFEETLRTFPDHARVICVYRGEQPVAASIVHWRGAWMEVPWASTLREFNAVAANMFLYWRMIQFAIERGCTRFEFGRCAPGEGTFQFKKQWGAEPSPLVWEYWMQGGKPARFDLHQGDSGYGRAAQIWRRLPLRVSTLVGPHLVRGIPC